ncbi:DNA-binding protein, partial [Xanthobacter flavus]
LTEAEEAAREAAQGEYDRLSEEHADVDELPEEVDARLGALEAMLEAFEARPLAFDPAEVARAGAFVSIAQDGKLRVERGFVRPEDEVPVEEDHDPSIETDGANLVASSPRQEAAAGDAPG